LTNYLLAGGGTAGHVNPLLALAEEIRRLEPESKIVVIGTAEGLESNLVPERGFRLEIIERLPFPRKLSGYALTFPFRYRQAVSKIRQLILTEKIDVLVGFGGYVSAPAYDAAKRTNLPYVIHEANALPGLANRRAARSAAAVATTFANTQLPGAVQTGMPLRPELESSLTAVNRAQARKELGLDPEMVTLLVTGGSLGAKRINETVWKSRKQLLLAGVQVLHIVGNRSDMEPLQEKNYLRLKYCERMDLAIASADLAVSRAGAATVCEFAAFGLPALFVPYPVGNGEQALNAKSLVDAGGAVMVRDADFDPGYVSAELIPLISDSRKLKKMSEAAKAGAILDATARLLSLVKSVLKR
jgi:UDP-N-acetylglucosamine--N-acetylmuramyl-(pentapeptide) pyrophosphoryl-undecaprenol N-acetylglucosamine transferase